MKTTNGRVWGGMALIIGGLACSESGQPDTVPDVAAAAFSAPLRIDNTYFPLPIGAAHAYFGRTEAGAEIIIVQVLDETRSVMGIEARVVRDRVFVDGELVEDTDDWFAQDDEGNVWYLGEEVVDYEYDDEGNVVEMTSEGAWEAGKDVAANGSVALPGYQMLAAPAVGRTYHQEYYVEEAEDAAEVLRLDAEVTLSDGRRFTTLETREFSTEDPDADERKHYAPGLGLVLESQSDGSDRIEYLGTFDESQPAPDFEGATFSAPTTIDNPFFPLTPGSTIRYESETEDGVEETVLEVLATERTVAGIRVVTVRDRVHVDGVLVEDTHDWFAQDDAGNVWYLGEEVDEYVYDVDGALVEVTHGGAWEAGLDVAEVGSVAEPGIIMPASPAPGTSYRQELYRGEAEDMAYVIATGATMGLSNGTTYEGVLQTLDWVPLEPNAVEIKYYAPGVGLIASRHVDSDEILELTLP